VLEEHQRARGKAEFPLYACGRSAAMHAHPVGKAYHDVTGELVNERPAIVVWVKVMCGPHDLDLAQVQQHQRHREARQAPTRFGAWIEARYR